MDAQDMDEPDFQAADEDGLAAVVALPEGHDLAPVEDSSTEISISEPLSLDDAKALTERIKSAAVIMWALIARAHAGRAWEALGYPSFEAYVRNEFDISRSRGYQLLNQAKVIQAIEAAVPDGTDLQLSEAAARDLKGVIDEVVPEIERRTQDLPPDEAGDVVQEIVEDWREKVRTARENQQAEAEADEAEMDLADRRGFSDGSGGTWTPPEPPVPPVYDEDDIDPAVIRRNVQAAYDLYSSLNALKSMPDQDDVINTIPVERRMQIMESLRPALEWLNEFTVRWEAQPWQAGAVGDDLDDLDGLDDDSAAEYDDLDEM